MYQVCLPEKHFFFLQYLKNLFFSLAHPVDSSKPPPEKKKDLCSYWTYSLSYYPMISLTLHYSSIKINAPLQKIAAANCQLYIVSHKPFCEVPYRVWPWHLGDRVKWSYCPSHPPLFTQAGSLEKGAVLYPLDVSHSSTTKLKHTHILMSHIELTCKHQGSRKVEKKNSIRKKMRRWTLIAKHMFS